MVSHTAKIKIDQNRKIAKYVSKFWIYGAKMLDESVETRKKNFVPCPFFINPG